MKTSKACEIFSQFKKRYTRECNFILKLYNLSEDSIIKTLETDKHNNWYRFKTSVKIVQGWFDGYLPFGLIYTCKKMIVERLETVAKDEEHYEQLKIDVEE